MSSETEKPTKGWTIETYAVHNEAMRRADDKFQGERDRRYSEVNIEREKALKIKEEADKVALDLARQIQTYKDEKANELRSQIESERGTYTTKDELKAIVEKFETALQPVQTYVTSQQGAARGSDKTINYFFTALVVFNILLGIYIAIR